MNFTPLLQQYSRIKKKYKDAILLFRIGDFYETLYEDAKLVSKVLGIALTQRQKGVPLAGVPHHAVRPYIAKLVKAGYKVAICEQLEEPKPGKLVKRDVIEVMTKGTLLDDSLLESKKNNYLASVSSDGKRYGLAFIDLSTGDFKITELELEELIDELKKINPAEVIVPENLSTKGTRLPSVGQECASGTELKIDNIEFTPRDSYEFLYDFASRELLEYFKVASLDGFGCKDLKLGVSAGGAALAYVKDTKKKELAYIKHITPYSLSKHLILDEPTRKNLELINKIGGTEGEGTLLWVLDYTCTPMGGRLLRSFILFPLIDVREINSRLDKVEEFVSSSTILDNVRLLISKIPDLERLIARISGERANARDLKALAKALKVLPDLNSVLPERFKNYKFPNFEATISLVDKAIVDNPPITIQEGNIIKTGFNKELDELQKLAFSGKQWISNFEAKERQRIGIKSLKVGFNSVFGYYIEITRPNLKLVPSTYIRKQTLVNAERFITQELKEYESKVLSAEERIKRLEYELFCELRGKVATKTPDIQETAQKIAELDIFASFARMARENRYVKPIVDNSDNIVIKNGRHPVVEQLLQEGDFVPNPTSLNLEQEIYIITGPNMSGKSTYLRQVGLIVLMAQIGSFVPASEAHIGVCDRLFTRIGASDDLARGVSTFLAEMNETANILNNASSRSLVLLDEIGRGTSTFDGMSIAWATIEYLSRHIECKVLFATHYHELTELATLSSKIKNYQIAVKRYEDEIIFLRQLRPGGCDESYGIDVAKLAGLPENVIKRAKEILSSLKVNEQKASKLRAKSKQRDLFEPTVRSEKPSPVLKELEKVDSDKLTPIDALLLIKKLKTLQK
ncbi:DNA mismatch repair protein MutS [candidate division WOR-3 bacterium]|nr:DNA mismatch repair protein MutS [candidate division WOR-3 bacterium]